MNYILRDDELNGCLEYDLKRYLHEDIRGLFTSPPRLTWRQVAVWIRHLPGDSALARKGFVAGGWTRQEHLTASVIDTLRVFQYHWFTSKVSEPDDLEEPVMLTRPDHDEQVDLDVVGVMVRRWSAQRVGITVAGVS